MPRKFTELPYEHARLLMGADIFFFFFFADFCAMHGIAGSPCSTVSKLLGSNGKATPLMSETISAVYQPVARFRFIWLALLSVKAERDNRLLAAKLFTDLNVL